MLWLFNNFEPKSNENYNSCISDKSAPYGGAHVDSRPSSGGDGPPKSNLIFAKMDNIIKLWRSYLLRRWQETVQDDLWVYFGCPEPIRLPYIGLACHLITTVHTAPSSLAL